MDAPYKDVCEAPVNSGGGLNSSGRVNGLRCSVHLTSPSATPRSTTPRNSNFQRVCIDSLSTVPCLATPLTTPGGRARATRAGGVWKVGSGVGDARLQQIEMLLEQQRAHMEGLREEAAALRDYLADEGVLDCDRYLMCLHRRRFASVLKAHPLVAEAGFADVLAAQELSLDIARYTGMPAIQAVAAASHAAHAEMANAESSIKQLFSMAVYVCGGFDGVEGTNTAERFDPAIGAWEPIPPMLERRSVLGAAIIAGQLYVCGGHNGNHFLSSVERFDPASDAWEQLPNMSECRWGAVSLALSGRLYICGGYNGAENLATAECFDPAIGEWQVIAPMQVGRGGAAATVFEGRIYMCGGCCQLAGGCKRYLSSVECFDPVKENWEAVAPMSVERGHAAAATTNGRLLVCGGCDDRWRHSSAEWLSPISNNCPVASWELLAPMCAGRVGPASAVVAGKLYVCGGHDGENFLSSAERYNPLSNQWELLRPMSGRRGYAAASVLGGKLYVCGGSEGAEFRRSVERFDPATGEWELLPPMRGRRASATAVALWSCSGGSSIIVETAALPALNFPSGTLSGVANIEDDGVTPGINLPTPPTMLGTPEH